MYRMTVEDEIRHDAMQLGMQKGMQKGMHKKQENIVLNMFSKGLDMQTISEYTDLDIAEVQKIRDNSLVSSKY